MRAWLVQPIDRWVIRLATRAQARHQPHRPATGAALAGPLPDGDIASRLPRPTVPELSLAADGCFQFPSPVRTPSDRNNTVRGKLYRAGDRWQSHPTAILLHGWNAELCYRLRFPYLAFLLRREGINTVTFELPYHMHRRPLLGPVRDFISNDLQSMFEATRQAVADVRALHCWLQAQGSNAGVWGFSLGGWLAGLVARLEPSLRFAALTTPIARMDRAVAELPFCEPVRRGLDGKKVDFADLNLPTRAPRLDTNRILLIQSCYDQFAPPETIEELWAAWNRPEIWRVRHGHISVLASLPITLRTVRWIAERLRGSF